MYLGLFLPAKYVFGDYFGVPRLVDAQEKILLQIIIFSSVLLYLRVFQPAEYVFGIISVCLCWGVVNEGETIYIDIKND